MIRYSASVGTNNYTQDNFVCVQEICRKSSNWKLAGSTLGEECVMTFLNSKCRIWDVSLDLSGETWDLLLANNEAGRCEVRLSRHPKSCRSKGSQIFFLPPSSPPSLSNQSTQCSLSISPTSFSESPIQSFTLLDEVRSHRGEYSMFHF